MRRLCPYGLTLLLLFLPVSIGLSDQTNPHLKDPCSWSGCHTVDPAGGSVVLIGESIDGTCCRCHTEKCDLSQGVNHLSNVDRWDREEFRRPQSLPLYGGYITCATCHYRFKPQGADYKLVRIYTVRGQSVTWEGLCRDCHAHH